MLLTTSNIPLELTRRNPAKAKSAISAKASQPLASTKAEFGAANSAGNVDPRMRTPTKSGIKPMWEDPGNVRGGKWVIRLKKNKIDRAWENVCMAMLGEQFLVGPEICGVVLSTQFPEDLLSIWNRTATDTTSTNRIRDTLRRILNLPPSTHMEYKPHCDSLKYL
ncbi:eukaryotic translation initiation factor 4e type [Culex quinquefasciatus]|uniref:Eukaryotic translation initiation factor 4e type n=1 Tax=Culex quinquefasciatus TaxID=7176 RepID=B0WY26_CULQU|nr:eukaryotic translation initiation factor 4e type [Culex quinquefasciatus]|eukprot:XP_001862298.1 eukaryotic translation initiation factor 4e type [Culex quinquefasciatus]